MRNEITGILSWLYLQSTSNFIFIGQKNIAVTNHFQVRQKKANGYNNEKKKKHFISANSCKYKYFV